TTSPRGTPGRAIRHRRRPSPARPEAARAARAALTPSPPRPTRPRSTARPLAWTAAIPSRRPPATPKPPAPSPRTSDTSSTGGQGWPQALSGRCGACWPDDDAIPLPNQDHGPPILGDPDHPADDIQHIGRVVSQLL